MSALPLPIGLDENPERTGGGLHPWLDPIACDRARLARDARFDGRFFTGVLTTRIYCRPICPVRPARSEHVRFFPSAAAAEQAGFRPCLRCRPELAPGLPMRSGAAGVITRALDLLHRGFLDEHRVEDLGEAVGVGSRHLNRLFDRHLGAPPGVIARTRRVQTAKLLLSETTLPITAIAFAAGFASIRRFNAAFVETYGSAPSHIRRASPRRFPSEHTITLRLGFRAPLNWPLLQALLEAEATPGVEEVNRRAYRRTVLVNGFPGWLEAGPVDRGDYLKLSLALPEYSHLRDVLAQVRRMFDLDADPMRIAQQLVHEPIVGPLIRTWPGVRLPGSWDGFEVAVRALVAKYVAAARVNEIMARLVRTYGRRVGREPAHLFPTPQVLANAQPSSALPQPLARDIGCLAKATAGKAIRFDASMAFADLATNLRRIANVGAPEAHWIAMRTLGEPDAGPFDPGERGESWRPWRSYVAALQSYVRLQGGNSC
jgi:AraC family transcriptional regulator, regulatory protein of adaptative response / DNA-3-methyladenine glycosylase II